VVASPSHRRMGGYAELAIIDEREAALKSPALSHVEAASLPLVGLTAWDCLVRHGKLESGQRVFIQAGSGGVGTIAVQLARSLGAEVLTTCSARNAELVASLGADRVIDYAREDYEQVAAGVDLVLESLGPAHLDRAYRMVRRGGRLITISPGVPEAVARLGPYLGIARVGASLLYRTVRYRLGKGVRFRAVTRKSDGEALARIMDLATNGAIVPVLDSVLPLADAAEAHRRLESGHRRGKVVLAVA
ncbi:MAG: NADP-dependent oxidoreductase, partial [Deltaproteobacteria bacterium]|nr:NADP-dependent oxidoreductase [Deltaproteobacteria bacterium]